MSSKHLTIEERFTISQMLSEQQSFKAIGAAIGKNCTTVSREIKNHMTFCKTGGYGRVYNACIHRKDCHVRKLCADCRQPGNLAPFARNAISSARTL